LDRRTLAPLARGLARVVARVAPRIDSDGSAVGQTIDE
jgi:hypothetical protein